MSFNLVFFLIRYVVFIVLRKDFYRIRIINKFLGKIIDLGKNDWLIFCDLLGKM